MFKKSPSKAELRDQLDAEVARFLQQGGKIKQVAMGESGLVDGRYNQHKPLFERPEPQQRTPVHNLLAHIDARRKQKTTRTVSKRRTSTNNARKQVIYDDFGEPVRTVWVDE